MASPLASLIDLNATFGALFIGFGASCLFVTLPPAFLPAHTAQTVRFCRAFGVVSMQAYSYFRRYPLDVWWYKCLVRAHLARRVACAKPIYAQVAAIWSVSVRINCAVCLTLS